MREALQIIQVADQVALLVFRALADRPDHVHGRTPVRTVARTELLGDHTPFGVDLFGHEADEVRPVVQNQQGAVHDALADGRHVADVIHGLVPRGSGVEVGAELHADFLQVFDDHFTRQILRTVEGHVLQEVGETLLVVVLLDGADVVQDIEVGLVLRLFVMADVVGHPVLQPARADVLVRGNRLHGIELSHNACRCHDGDKQHD